MGRKAMALMVDRLNGKRTAETIVLETELVVRGSVAPCRPLHR
jgi:LacI family repressor for deo operon, udp, cdd, tsx, nupC, and nupG